jgi:tRNA1(Val) A37 N6-methylase TrmN6
MELTEGTLLGGRIRYRQPREGYRTGIEPVLLAASVTPRPGERVLEGGTGAGAALLCLAARLPGITGLGVERDTALAALADANLRENGADGMAVTAADLLTLQAGASFDHAIANPPWHDARGTPSSDKMRDAAKRSDPALMDAWAAALARALRHGGSLTLIIPAAATAAALAALARAHCGSPALLPLWPHAGKEARLMLLRAVKDGRGASRILPGLVLHEGDGFSAAARTILWDGGALSWD